MKTLQFKLCILLLTSSLTLVAQKENIYKKSYKTNKNTTAFLKLTGGTVKVETSPDDNFYVEYNIEFNNYSKRKKKKIIEKIKIETKISNNHITLFDKSKSYRSSRIFNNILQSLYKKDSTKRKEYIKKTKQDFIEELKEVKAPISFYNEFVKNNNRLSEIEKEKLINKHNNLKRRKNNNKDFIIKIPKTIELTIDAKNTIIRLNNHLENKLSVRLSGGKFIAKSLSNNSNVIKVKDAMFLVDNINGGELSLNNVRKGLINSLNKVNLLSEFSNLEIGEIKKNNIIKGFSNDILVHNFSKNFNQFNLTLEYSKFRFFNLTNDYQLNIYGYNTIVDNNSIIKKSTSSKNNTKAAFFVKNSNNENLSSGIMNFNANHSFIYIR